VQHVFPTSGSSYIPSISTYLVWSGHNLSLVLQYGAVIQFTQLSITFRIQMKWLIIEAQIFTNQHLPCWLI